MDSVETNLSEKYFKEAERGEDAAKKVISDLKPYEDDLAKSLSDLGLTGDGMLNDECGDGDEEAEQKAKELIENLVTRARNRAIRTYTLARLTGHDNDHSSEKGKGIKIFVNQETMQILIDRNLCEREDFVQMGDLFVLHFPNGTFYEMGNNIQIYRDYNPNVKDNISEVSNPMSIPINEYLDEGEIHKSGLVRVVSDECSLWQNKRFDWNGKERTAQEIEEIRRQCTV